MVVVERTEDNRADQRFVAALWSSQQALKAANVEASTIDLIIVATSSAGYGLSLGGVYRAAKAGRPVVAPARSMCSGLQWFCLCAGCSARMR
jgi:hypothetical protein